MGADLSLDLTCKSKVCDYQFTPGDGEFYEIAGPSSHFYASTLLHVSVPRGPTFTSGVYRLVEDQYPNGFPLWKATHSDLWMYSMTTGKWGIGGPHEFHANFQAGAAFVFNDRPHQGRMPHAARADSWMHNRPAWTVDPGIKIENWPELITVCLQKEKKSDRFGMHMSIMSATETPESMERGKDLNDDVLSEGCPTLNVDACDLVLRIRKISEGSLLAQWNETATVLGRRGEVVAPGSEILSVGRLTEPWRMREALLREPYVEMKIRRPPFQSKAKMDEGGSDFKNVVVPKEPEIPELIF